MTVRAERKMTLVVVLRWWPLKVLKETAKISVQESNPGLHIPSKSANHYTVAFDLHCSEVHKRSWYSSVSVVTRLWAG